MSDRSRPLFSIVTPVYKPRPDHLQLTIDSVRHQTFSDWEWILVDDASKDHGVTAVLERAAAEDSRICVVTRPRNGHIVAASNDGLARARGTWTVFIDHDDLLVKEALERLSTAIKENPDAGYVYTDEDKIDDAGVLSDTFRKPDWSPERLRHQMYLGHLSAMRSDLVRKVGGFHKGFDGSQDHDLALRVTEISKQVVHIPEVLYHWRIVPGSAAGDVNAKDYATAAGIRAVQEHLKRLGRAHDVVTATRVAHTYATWRSFNPETLVSVVIPTCGSTGLAWGEHRCFVVEAVRSLLNHTKHRNIEIVIVFDRSTPATVLEQLRGIGGNRIVLEEFDAPFNFSDKCNRGFLASSGDVVVFLNDDVEIQSEDFIEQLCAPLEEESVGMTGARLNYSDGSIQHAGLIMQDTEFVHAYLAQPDESFGFFGELVVDHEVSGLTAACVALRRDVVNQVGGFRLDLPSNFNDVDFSCKVRSLGYRLVWLHDVRATHFESQTRKTTVYGWEVEAIIERWGEPTRDPYMPMEADRVISLIERTRKATQAQ